MVQAGDGICPVSIPGPLRLRADLTIVGGCADGAGQDRDGGAGVGVGETEFWCSWFDLGFEMQVDGFLG